MTVRLVGRSNRRRFVPSLVLVASIGLSGCHESVPKPPEVRQAAQSAEPVIRYSTDRIRFPPAPIAALESIAPAAPLVRSLLNVQSLMRYGDFVWKDDVPAGRVWVLVDLAAQTISVFRDGEEIGRAVALFGVDGYSTPTGRFTVLAREKHHVSSVYGSSMPYTLRLTNDGISIHASNVREGIGTHGCVGVPLKFGAKLFDAMRAGDEVVIISDRERPAAASRGASAKAIG